MENPTSLTPERLAEDLRGALAQLRRSERGMNALMNFAAFMDADNHDALGLDGSNWEAIEILARSCRFGGAANIRSVLPERKKPRRG